MKKIFLLSAFFLSALIASSQGTYMGIGVNYGMPCAGSVLGTKYTEDLLANTNSTENVRGSFGTGITVGYYAGYMFNANVGLDVNADYLWGKKYEFTSSVSYGNGGYTNTSNDVSATTFRVSPEIRLVVPSGKFYPYAKAGAAFGLYNKIINDYTGTDQSSGGGSANVTERRYEFTQGLSIGCLWGLGARYSFGDNLSVFGELGGYLSSWAPEKAEMVKATFNGQDVLSTTDVADKEFEFKDKIDRNGTYDPNVPTQILKTYYPMSSFGLNVGVHFSF